jgi:hypothetical protein
VAASLVVHVPTSRILRSRPARLCHEDIR